MVRVVSGRRLSLSSWGLRGMFCAVKDYRGGFVRMISEGVNKCVMQDKWIKGTIAI